MNVYKQIFTPTGFDHTIMAPNPNVDYAPPIEISTPKYWQENLQLCEADEILISNQFLKIA
jgi:hypothetical protein